MSKLKPAFFVFPICAICFLICVISSYASEESLTITTYYPSPYGSYRELRSQRIAIGDNYIAGDQYCWEGTCTNTINANADLVVEGNVGIGTVNPVGADIYDRVLQINSGTLARPNIRLVNSGTEYKIAIEDVNNSLYIVNSNGNVLPRSGKGIVIDTDGNVSWSGDHSRDGYIRMGNMQVCWGNGVAQGQGMIGHTPGSPSYIVYSDLTFPSGCVFNNSTYSLTANPTSTSGNAKAFVGPFLISPGTTGATLYFHKISDTAQEEMTSTGPVPYSWIAIGTWR